MIDPELRDPGDDRRRHHVGRIESAAKPDLDDAHVGGRAAEGEEGGGGGDFEEARRQVGGVIEHFGEQGREGIVGDEGAGEADPLVEADQMRAGVDVRGKPRRFDRRTQERAGRAFAVRARDMDHRGQAVVRITESVKQRRDALEPKDVRAGGKRPEPVELGLDR